MEGLAQELQQVLSELICVLEECTVTGTVVHLQLALGNLAVHIVGVDGGVAGGSFEVRHDSSFR